MYSSEDSTTKKGCFCACYTTGDRLRVVPHVPLGYFSEQKTGARLTFLAGGNFEVRSRNSLALLSLRKMRDYL